MGHMVHGKNLGLVVGGQGQLSVLWNGIFFFAPYDFWLLVL